MKINSIDINKVRETIDILKDNNQKPTISDLCIYSSLSYKKVKYILDSLNKL